MILSFNAKAQITISAFDIYHAIGEYELSYFRSNIDLTPFIGTTGSNVWDFSQSQAANDVIGEMDVVTVSDSGDAGDFPGAAFSLNYQGGAISGTSWEYYSLDATNGLVYYGIYDPVGYGASPVVTANPPISYMPASLSYGQLWTNQYDFDITDPYFGVFQALYQSSSKVDAYGTLLLPGITSVPALRIIQVENYYENIDGDWFSFQVDTNWIWVAPGLGYAAQATWFAPDDLGVDAQPYTNSLSRVFFYPPQGAPPSPTLTVQSNAVTLTWNTTPKVAGYAILTSTNLASGPWLPLAQLTNESFSVSMTPGAREVFYRIIGQP